MALRGCRAAPPARPGPSLTLGVTVGIALLLLAACSKKEEEAQPVVSVRVAKAEVGAIAQPIELVGTIAARQEASVGPKIGGQIAQMALLKNRVVLPSNSLGLPIIRQRFGAVDE